MAVKFTRTLYYKMSGTDVRYMKDCLFQLKQYKSSIKKISNSTFGADTLDAVKKYQKSHKDIDGKALKVDGIIGRKTWNAVVRDSSISTEPVKKIYLTKKEYPNLSETTINKLNDEWQELSAVRIKIMQLALKQAYDAVNGIYKKGDKPVCLYIIGADLYDKHKKLFHPTKSYIESRAKARPDYFTGGRKEWMISQVEDDPDICATDCSGQEVGILRFLDIVKPTFDTTANGLCGKTYSAEITKAALKPGDWVGRDGHIGIFLGADMVCEAAGGAYGVQVTKFSDRKCRNLMNGKIASMKPWTKYRKPKLYE